MDINLFNSMNYLEPRCPGCKTVLNYGINTEYSDELHSHRCVNCGIIL